MATGEWILVLDADDELGRESIPFLRDWLSRKLSRWERTLNWVKRRPALAGLVVVSVVAVVALGVVAAAMVHNALRANQAVAIRLDEAWIGVLGPALPAVAATAVAIAVYLAVLAALGLIAWRRPASTTGFAVLAVALSLLASPHALPHDLLMLAVPAWLAVDLFFEGRLPNPIPGLLLIDLALLIDLHGVGLPLGPIVMTAVVLWYGWRFRQRAQQHRRPPVVQAA